MCDEGRYGYQAIDAPARLKVPTVRSGDGWQETTWDDALLRTASALRNAIQSNGPGSVAVLASPQMTNEELFRVRQLFGDGLGIGTIEFRVPPRLPGSADDFLITADKNPNTRGAEALGLAGPGVEEILDACRSGKVRVLYVCHHDLTLGYDPATVAAALETVEFVVFQGSHSHPTAELARVQLPAAVYAEREGTFTNVQGRVQRINAAVPPLGESLPDLEILSRLGSALGIPLTAGACRDVFEEIGKRTPAFAGMTYETVGDTGQTLG